MSEQKHLNNHKTILFTHDIQHLEFLDLGQACHAIWSRHCGGGAVTRWHTTSLSGHHATLSSHSLGHLSPFRLPCLAWLLTASPRVAQGSYLSSCLLPWRRLQAHPWSSFVYLCSFCSAIESALLSFLRKPWHAKAILRGSGRGHSVAARSQF